MSKAEDQSPKTISELHSFISVNPYPQYHDNFTVV